MNALRGKRPRTVDEQSGRQTLPASMLMAASEGTDDGKLLAALLARLRTRDSANPLRDDLERIVREHGKGTGA